MLNSSIFNLLLVIFLCMVLMFFFSLNFPNNFYFYFFPIGNFFSPIFLIFFSTFHYTTMCPSVNLRNFPPHLPVQHFSPLIVWGLLSFVNNELFYFLQSHTFFFSILCLMFKGRPITMTSSMQGQKNKRLIEPKNVFFFDLQTINPPF